MRNCLAWGREWEAGDLQRSGVDEIRSAQQCSNLGHWGWERFCWRVLRRRCGGYGRFQLFGWGDVSRCITNVVGTHSCRVHPMPDRFRDSMVLDIYRGSLAKAPGEYNVLWLHNVLCRCCISSQLLNYARVGSRGGEQYVSPSKLFGTLLSTLAR